MNNINEAINADYSNIPGCKTAEDICDACGIDYSNIYPELPHGEGMVLTEFYNKEISGEINILGLYRRDNGDEFIHYAVTNEQGQRRELLTNGMYAWADEGRNAERINTLSPVDRIDTDKMENLLNKYQPDKTAMQALETVKQTQLRQAQQIKKPQML